MSRRGGQLDLFGAAEPERWWSDEIDRLAAGLHPLVHLGTSSWTFPGWAGLCYPRRISEQRLLDEGLGLYARYPLFRTVGIDRSHYRPVPRDELAKWATQVPPTFRCVEKVWDRLTIPVFPHLPRFGDQAGRPNASFLDPEPFLDEVWAPHVGTFDRHVAAFVLEFAPMPAHVRPSPSAFARKLDAFLAAMPPGPTFAVELRNRELLTDEYLAVLDAHGATHVYNWWTHMPELRDQLARVPVRGGLVVSRLLLRPGTEYAERKEAFAPFDRIHDPSEEMRADVVDLVGAAIAEGAPVHVIVNNKAEGSSPLTIAALAERLQTLGLARPADRA